MLASKSFCGKFGKLRRIATVLAVSLTAMLIPMTPAHAVTLTQVTGFGSNPGNLVMYKYVPSGLPANAPVVVVLHGATQEATNYANENGWAKYADLWKFSLVFPKQQNANDTFLIFGWYKPEDQNPGGGEALSIKQMVDKMLVDHQSDATRVYVTGLSAGGAMTSVMAGAYPGVFKGAMIMAGLPYKCATAMSGAQQCASGRNLTPAQWGDLVRGANPGYSGPWPLMTIFHGDQDGSINVANEREIMEQWTNVHGIDQTPDTQDTVRGYPHKVWKNSSGVPLVESYIITGMAHGHAVDPGSNLEQCGATAQYSIDANICASYHTALFWGLNDTDTQAPTVSITSPTNGATVSGVVTIQANASDNVGVTKVEFLVDGNLLATDTASAYQASWDTGTASNGSHSLLARAHDAAGNTTTSGTISVTVSNGTGDVTAPTTNLTFPANGDTVSGTVNLSASASDDVGVNKVEFFLDGGSLGTGVANGGTGPWTLSWDTTSTTNASHALMVKAYDAAGNIGTDNDTSVTVSNAGGTSVLDETFSNRDGNGDYFDNTGWTAGGYVESTDNHNLTTGEQKSSNGHASSGAGCVTGLKTETLSRSVVLSNAPKLAYWRKLDLSAPGLSGKTAYLRVKINGTVVDEQSITSPATYAESTWTERPNIDLSLWANNTVTLAFEVGANSPSCIEAFAKAWIDDIRVGNAQDSSDTTPPTVNITAPANGAAVGGAVDITVTASDGVGVNKVEFYVDGMLLETDLSSPYATTWQTTNVSNGAHALMAKAYDAAGNVGTDNDTSVTVTNGGSPTTVVINNIDAEDGDVKAFSDGTGVALGSFSGHGLGRGSDSKFYRAVLSFDTSSIPDGATITRAYVTVSLSSSYSDPWASPAGNQLVIDVKNACFGACTIETGDWAASPTQSAVASIAKWTSGTTNSTEFNSAGMGAINKTGKTQVKLRFNQFQTSMRNIIINEGTTAKLTVEYLP